MENYKPLQGKLRNDFGYLVTSKGVVEDKRSVFCLHCKQRFSYSGSLSSLQYHLRAKHPVKAFATSSTESNAISGNVKSEVKLLAQPKLSDFLKNDKISANKQLEISNSLAFWVASSGRPLNIVEDKGLEKVLQTALNSVSYKMPTRKTIASRINNIFEIEKDKLQKKLDNTEFISLTGDFWTSVANDSYLGITAHWIDDSWNFQSAILQVKEVSQRHTSTVCADEFKKVADDWNIRHKIIAICTDNARNITSGVTEAQFENIFCSAHTLQLSLNKALSVAAIGNLLGHCRKIVGHYKHSSANKFELENQQKELGQKLKSVQQDVPTRWNSTFYMITSLLENRHAIAETLSDQKTNIRVLNAAEWEKLSALKLVLEPCLAVTELLGGEKYVSASVVFPAIAYLQAQMHTTEDDPGFIARFKTVLIDDIKERMANWPYLNKYEICTALDPRFKSLNCMPTERRDAIWEDVLQKMKQFGNIQFQNSKNENQAKRRKLCFNALNSDMYTETPQSSCPYDTELKLYKEVDEVDDDFINPLAWWKIQDTKFPILSSLAKRMLCMTATSVPVERVFSSAGFIVNKLRSSLDPENVNVLVCLRDWLN